MPQIISLAFQADSRFYFERLLDLPGLVWLDSGKPKALSGRFDILTAAPVKKLIDVSPEVIEEAVANLGNTIRSTKISQLALPFCGGAIGYFDYEYQHLNHGLPGVPARCAFGIYDWCLIQDHQTKKACAVFLPQCPAQKVSNIMTLLDTKPGVDNNGSIREFLCSDFIADIKYPAYQDAVNTIKRYILAGDTYQINYSQCFRANFSGDPASAYLQLRTASPSPFSAFLDLRPGETVLSLSPEQFISVDDRLAVTRPIKGTAARASDPDADAQLASELLQSTKNRAENLMIVDLLRNDFSKACELNSVRVPRLFQLESFANVHHLVSTIEGKIMAGVSPLQFFLNCFPGGSITGAPKRRSMEIIDQLETQKRTVYCGSICYLSVHGRFDSNIAIRTLRADKDQILCWGGGGIVADSNPEEEYAESLQKIQLLLDTLSATTVC